VKTVDRVTRTTDGESYAKMTFSVQGDPYVDREKMWVELTADGHYKLRNIPGWTSGVGLDDEVVGHVRRGILWFAGVTKSSGHSTYRIAIQDPDDVTQVHTALGRLRDAGCGVERLSPRIFAVDVPADVNIFATYAMFERGMADGVWWFDEMHVGHDLTTPPLE
jgi:Domain of unknown function (DUF4265)